MRMKLCCLLLLFVVTNAHAEPTEFKEWGVGIIGRADCIYEGRGVNFPTDTFNVHDAPNGKIIGNITAKKIDDYLIKYFLTLNKKNKIIDISQYLNADDLIEIGYEDGCFKYYGEKNGFLKVFINHYAPGLWIRHADLKKHGYHAFDWKQYLLCMDTDTIVGFYPRVEEGLKLELYDSSEENKKILTELYGDTYEIKLTGKVKGRLFEADVVLYDIDPCGGDQTILKRWKGWVRAIGDDKSPNIWYFTKGC